MTDLHRITIEPLGIGDHGQRYSVHHGDIVLVQSTRDPEFDACRALLAKGLTGRLEIWRHGTTFPAMRLDIAMGAGLTVEESDRIGPRFARWRPFPEEANINGIFRSDGSPRTAADKAHKKSGRPRASLGEFSPRFTEAPTTRAN